MHTSGSRPEHGRIVVLRRRVAQWPRHPLLLVEAALFTSLLRLALRRRGAAAGAALASRLAKFGTASRREADDGSGYVDPVIRCVAAVCGHRPFRSSCLPKSLTVWAMLRRRRIDTEVRVGVRGATEGFASHAWVERNSVALGEDPALISTFIALSLGSFLSGAGSEYRSNR